MEHFAKNTRKNGKEQVHFAVQSDGAPFPNFQTLKKFNQRMTTRNEMTETGATYQKSQSSPVLPGRNATSRSGVRLYRSEMLYPAANCPCTLAGSSIPQRNALVPRRNTKTGSETAMYGVQLLFARVRHNPQRFPQNKTMTGVFFTRIQTLNGGHL
jgi:hypothetical protein